MIQLVQCWDDGVVEDIRLTELLRARGAKATFNLNPGLHGPSRGHGWSSPKWPGRQILRLSRPELPSIYRGFTIANHTVSHPWPLKTGADAWRAEVFDGRKRLQDIFGQPVAGFAYPFGQYDRAVADVVREAGHAYARTCENATPCAPAPDRFAQPTDCHFLAPDFWERYARAKTGGARVFYFWGHSYELHTDAEWDAFDRKIARLSSDPEALWAELPDALA